MTDLTNRWRSACDKVTSYGSSRSTTPTPIRMLIVQALNEGLAILTFDRALELYRMPVVWA